LHLSLFLAENNRAGVALIVGRSEDPAVCLDSLPKCNKSYFNRPATRSQ